MKHLAFNMITSTIVNGNEATGNDIQPLYEMGTCLVLKNGYIIVFYEHKN